MYVPTELYPALSDFESKACEYSKLSHEEERELYRRFLDCKDEQARRYLVGAYSRHAITIALKYCQYGLPLSALIDAGKLGIAHGLTNFDSEFGHRLSTYVAYWIRVYILNYAIHSLRSAEAISGMSDSKLVFKLRRERVRIAGLLSMGVDRVAAALSN